MKTCKGTESTSDSTGPHDPVAFGSPHCPACSIRAYWTDCYTTLQKQHRAQAVRVDELTAELAVEKGKTTSVDQNVLATQSQQIIELLEGASALRAIIDDLRAVVTRQGTEIVRRGGTLGRFSTKTCDKNHPQVFFAADIHCPICFVQQNCKDHTADADRRLVVLESQLRDIRTLLDR
jgi:hypothetical protein